MSERTMISINPVNFVTIGLMAIGAFILVGAGWQAFRALTGGGGGGGGGGETAVVSTGGEVDLG